MELLFSYGDDVFKGPGCSNFKRPDPVCTLALLEISKSSVWLSPPLLFPQIAKLLGFLFPAQETSRST